jgi:hypothetical protein
MCDLAYAPVAAIGQSRHITRRQKNVGNTQAETMREKRGKVAQGHWNGNQVMGAQSLKINEGKSIWRVVDAEVRHARCPGGKGGGTTRK